MKIGIGVPSGDHVVAATAFCIMGAQQVTAKAGHFVTVRSVRTNSPDTSQNHLIELSLADGDDFLMLIDSDMLLPPDVILRLLAAFDDEAVGIAGCVYRARSAPFPVWGESVEHVEHDFTGSAAMLWIPSGMMLIRRAMLAAIPYPQMEKLYGTKPVELVGHDPNFCAKARAAGFKVIADFGLSREISHCALVPIPT